MEYRFLDVIWLDNLFVNFIVLWLTWKISGNTSPVWRLWCSACIGACYAVLLVLPGFSVLSDIPLKILLSLVMLAAGFRIYSLLKAMKLLVCFYGITFLLGGAAFGFYYFFNADIQVSEGIFLIRDFPVKVIIYSLVLVIMMRRWLQPLFQLRINRRQLVYQVEVHFGEDSVNLDALLDTGNELADPVSGRPVMVVELDSIRSILPPEIQKIYMERKEQQLDYVAKILSDSTWISRFFIIPYRTLSTNDDYLLAFRPDLIRIFSDGTWTEARQSLVGIRDNKLSADDEYHALIQPQIIP